MYRDELMEEAQRECDAHAVAHRERVYEEQDAEFEEMGKIPDDGYEKSFNAAFEKSRDEYFAKHGYYGKKNQH